MSPLSASQTRPPHRSLFLPVLDSGGELVVTLEFVDRASVFVVEQQSRNAANVNKSDGKQSYPGGNAPAAQQDHDSAGQAPGEVGSTTIDTTADGRSNNGSEEAVPPNKNQVGSGGFINHDSSTPEQETSQILQQAADHDPNATLSSTAGESDASLSALLLKQLRTWKKCSPTVTKEGPLNVVVGDNYTTSTTSDHANKTPPNKTLFAPSSANYSGASTGGASSRTQDIRKYGFAPAASLYQTQSCTTNAQQHTAKIFADFHELNPGFDQNNLEDSQSEFFFDEELPGDDELTASDRKFSKATTSQQTTPRILLEFNYDDLLQAVVAKGLRRRAADFPISDRFVKESVCLVTDNGTVLSESGAAASRMKSLSNNNTNAATIKVGGPGPTSSSSILSASPAVVQQPRPQGAAHQNALHASPQHTSTTRTAGTATAATATTSVARRSRECSPAPGTGTSAAPKAPRSSPRAGGGAIFIEENCNKNSVFLEFPNCEFLNVIVKWQEGLFFPHMVADLHQALVTGTYQARPDLVSRVTNIANGGANNANDLMVVQHLQQVIGMNNNPPQGMLPGGNNFHLPQMLNNRAGNNNNNMQGAPGGGAIFMMNNNENMRNARGQELQLPNNNAILVQRQMYVLPSLEEWEVGLYQTGEEDLLRFGKTPSQDQVYGFSQLLQVIDRVKAANFVFPAQINIIFHQQELQRIGGLGAFLAEVAVRVVQSSKFTTNLLREVWTYREMINHSSSAGAGASVAISSSTSTTGNQQQLNFFSPPSRGSSKSPASKLNLSTGGNQSSFPPSPLVSPSRKEQLLKMKGTSALSSVVDDDVYDTSIHQDQWKTGSRLRATTVVHEILRQLRVFQVFELRHGLKAAVDGDKLSICERLLKNLALRGDLTLGIREEMWQNQGLTGDALLARKQKKLGGFGTSLHQPGFLSRSVNSSSLDNSSFLSRALLPAGSNGNGDQFSSQQAQLVRQTGNNYPGGGGGPNNYTDELSSSGWASYGGRQLPPLSSMRSNHSDTSNGADCASSVLGGGSGGLNNYNNAGAGGGANGYNYRGGTASVESLPETEVHIDQRSNVSNPGAVGQHQLYTQFPFSPVPEGELSSRFVKSPSRGQQLHQQQVEQQLSEGSSVEEELWCLYKHLMSNRLEYSWISLRWTCLKLILTLGGAGRSRNVGVLYDHDDIEDFASSSDEESGDDVEADLHSDTNSSSSSSSAEGCGDNVKNIKNSSSSSSSSCGEAKLDRKNLLQQPEHHQDTTTQRNLHADVVENSEIFTKMNQVGRTGTEHANCVEAAGTGAITMMTQKQQEKYEQSVHTGLIQSTPPAKQRQSTAVIASAIAQVVTRDRARSKQVTEQMGGSDAAEQQASRNAPGSGAKAANKSSKSKRAPDSKGAKTSNNPRRSFGKPKLRLTLAEKRLQKVFLRRIRSFVARRFQDLERFSRWSEKKLQDYDPWNKDSAYLYPDDYDQYRFLYTSEMHRRHLDRKRKAEKQLEEKVLQLTAAAQERAGQLEQQQNALEMLNKDKDKDLPRRPQVTAGGTRSILPFEEEEETVIPIVEDGNFSGVHGGRYATEHDRTKTPATVLAAVAGSTHGVNFDSASATAAALSFGENGGPAPAASEISGLVEQGGNDHGCSVNVVNNNPDHDDELLAQQVKTKRRKEECQQMITSIHETFRRDIVGIAAELLANTISNNLVDQVFVEEIETSLSPTEPVTLSAIKIFLQSFPTAFSS
ncbi:unnamed protein product [Amoebophrya sp. A120]|nr:unnamed protein product [Amoebophrya sp. A120]|eukprot:GSA120T00023605001.1